MIAPKERKTRPCRECGLPLYWTERLGWVHDGTGFYLVCPSRGENRPKDDAS